MNLNEFTKLPNYQITKCRESPLRLFVAIDLDEAARRAVAAEQRRLKEEIGHDSRPTLKWVRPEHMHLTLAFLGTVDERTTAVLVDAMREAMAYREFEVEFGGVGAFPPRGAPRVLWMGLRRGERDVVEVQRLVGARLVRIGVELERRPFHPHLTLARWREPRTTDRSRALRLDSSTVVARIHVRAVALVHSQLSQAGPTYSVLCEARLADEPGQPLKSSS